MAVLGCHRRLEARHLSGNPLSAEFLNPIIEEEMRWAVDTIEAMFGELYASGYPVGAKPLDKATIYQNLVAAMQSGDQSYWQDPNAQAQLAKLSEQFGAPPNVRPRGAM